MPSPSPNSRKTSSSVAPRNLAGSTRGDLPNPTRGLLQGTDSSSSAAARRSVYERIDDHKENNTENGNCRGIQGRPNQNQRGACRKPWVTHFAKPAATLSPSSRVLVDRNSSPSPRSGEVVQGYGEGLDDPKVSATPPREREEACATPGPVKGVADLSKRIQQFLEEQDVVLGSKTGSAQEVISSCASLTPVELGQRSVSSPYNPYKSPFFERPKFLRLNGSSASSTFDVVYSTTDVADATMEQTVEELPLFEGGQVLASPLQQIQFSNGLSLLSAEDEDITAHAEELQDQLSEATFDGASGDALQEKLQVVIENKEHILQESSEKSGQGSPCLSESLAKALAVVAEQSQVENVEVETDLQKEDGEVKAKIHSTPGVLASQLERKEDGAGKAEHDPQPQDTANQSQDEDMKSPRGKEMHTGLEYEGMEDNMGEELSWGRRAGRVSFCGALLASFFIFVLLSSAGPGLLPAALVNNPVQSSWHSSKYHTNSLAFVRGMEGLWSTHTVYLPIDVRDAVGRSIKILHSFRRSWTQVHLELQVFAELMSSILDDGLRVLMQHLSQRDGPNSDLEQEERGRQFEWLQDYEFEEDWLDETPLLAYTDWELLHEYDLGAANQFVLGSIPEVLKHDLRRNMSRLSDSPEVRGLLEDLMTLKGGNTEEDRLEVLRYFWQYTRFSASAGETLMQYQVKHQALGILGEQLIGKIDFAADGLPPEEQSTDMPAYCEQQQDSQPDLNEKAEAGSYISVVTGVPDLSKAPQDCLAEDSKLNQETESSAATFEQGGIEMKSSDVAVEVTWTPEQLQESDQIFPSIVPTLNENAKGSTDEWKGELADTLIAKMQPALAAKLDIGHIASLAIFVVGSMFVLARSRRPKSATSPVSTSVQFLRKTDQPQESLDGGKQQVTIIEELNDKFASVLQSPEPNLLRLQSLQTSRDEGLLRSPIPASTSSPYGSFTTYKLTQGQAGETKLTPVRRSSRIRSHISMSPQSDAVKRIAISPP
ncbi:hypothetical protein GOP47_0027122 [Adiantum capillus-veneris]|nr:hypothetical protein GOP47_0027122 [Adiantum capillus-veneris]